MNGREILHQYRDTEAEIMRLERELKEAQARAERVTTSYSLVKAGGNNQRSLEDAILRLDALKLEFCQLVDQQVSRRYEVGRVLDRLPNARDRLFFHMRYIDLMTWQKIGEELGLNQRYIYRLHGKLLALLDDLDHQSSTDSSQ